MLMKGTVAIIALLLFSPFALAAGPTSGGVSRFQLVAVNSEWSAIVFRVDTLTGKTWIFDTTHSDLATEEYLVKQGMRQSFPEERIKEITQSGYMVAIPTYWKEVPETASGVELKRIPAQK